MKEPDKNEQWWKPLREGRPIVDPIAQKKLAVK